MSQQYPGQPPGGGMPPGYGSGPAQQPQPGMYGGVPGQQPAAASAGTPNRNRMLLWLGVGCGGLLLFAIGVAVAGVLWFRARTSNAIEELQKLQGEAASGNSALSTTRAGAPVRELMGDCKAAYACCRSIAAKSTASADAVAACELFRTAGYPESTCAASLTGYRKAAEALGIRCE